MSKNTKKAERLGAGTGTRTRLPQLRVNRRNSIKNLSRLMNANFTERDIWLTLTYPPESAPDSWAEAVKDSCNYIRRLRRAAKMAGYASIRYIIITEERRSGNGSMLRRCHVVTDFPDHTTAEGIWNIYGGAQSRCLQPSDFTYEGMTQITGSPEDMRTGQQNSIRTHWRGSRNLVKPPEPLDAGKRKARPECTGQA